MRVFAAAHEKNLVCGGNFKTYFIRLDCYGFVVRSSACLVRLGNNLQIHVADISVAYSAYEGVHVNICREYLGLLDFA